MYQLKGFVNINFLTNNAVGTISPLGEASTWSKTYTKEQGDYESSANTGYRLISISSIDTDIGLIPVNPNYADHVLTVSRWILEHLTNQPLPISRTTFTEDILAQFNELIFNVSFGPIINSGIYNLPEWISWENIALPDNSLKVWFSDTAFAEQFDETEIVVIPPLDNLDDFFLNPTVLKSKIDAVTPSAYMDKIQAAKGKMPETVIRTESYPYINPAFLTLTFPTNWTVLIYGIAGDNVNSIKDAIIAYILENSTHTREQWTVLLPDLFKRTEFIVLPRWDKYAIPNKTTQAGIYSPLINNREVVSFSIGKIPEYAINHIEENLFVFNHSYKSITIATVGGIENKDGKFRIDDFFPDYINVSTQSIDFNRMELATQDWVYLLEQMLITAESMTEYSPLPSNMRRLKRGTMLYVVAVYKNIQYLVAAKLNYGN